MMRDKVVSCSPNGVTVRERKSEPVFPPKTHPHTNPDSYLSAHSSFMAYLRYSLLQEREPEALTYSPHQGGRGRPQEESWLPAQPANSTLPVKHTYMITEWGLIKHWGI